MLRTQQSKILAHPRKRRSSRNRCTCSTGCRSVRNLLYTSSSSHDRVKWVRTTKPYSSHRRRETDSLVESSSAGHHSRQHLNYSHSFQMLPFRLQQHPYSHLHMRYLYRWVICFISPITLVILVQMRPVALCCTNWRVKAKQEGVLVVGIVALLPSHMIAGIRVVRPLAKLALLTVKFVAFGVFSNLSGTL